MSFKNYPVFNVFESLLSLFQVLSKLGVYRDQNKFENPARPEAVVYISPDVPHGLKNCRYNFFILFFWKNTTLNFLKHILRACFCIFLFWPTLPLVTQCLIEDFLGTTLLTMDLGYGWMANTNTSARKNTSGFWAKMGRLQASGCCTR